MIIASRPLRLTMSILALVAAAILTAAGTRPAAAETWNLPTGFADTNMHTANVRAFAEDVEQATDGAIRINVHSTGSLFAIAEIHRAVRTGQVEIGEILPSLLVNEDPLFEFDTLPYVIPTLDGVRDMIEIMRPIVEQRFADQNLVLLYIVPWPSPGLFTNTEIASPEDLAGVRIRTYDRSSSRFVELIGAEPTLIPASEVPQAFATGIIDGMITSSMTGVDTHVWEHARYYIDAATNHPTNMLIINANVWNGLDADTQQAIREAAQRAEERAWEVMQTIEADSKATLRDHGMAVVPPSAALEDAMRQAGEIMQREWIERAGAEAESLLAEFGE